ncbi:MAG TPA: hypothetical protein VF193_01350 [Steroidobacter sp.]
MSVTQDTEHERQVRRMRKRGKFAGQWSSRARHQWKYQDAEYIGAGSRRLRLLTEREIEEFKAHVQRCIDERSCVAGRKETVLELERRLFKKWL